MVTYKLIPKSEAERLLRQGLARPMTEKEAGEFKQYLKRKAQYGEWLKVGTAVIDPKSLLDQIHSAEARAKLEEFERKSRARAKREYVEALKNQELIEKGLHPIYSRVPGKVEFKVEDGKIWRRHWLSGGQWSPWEVVKPVVAGQEYVVIPGKGVFSQAEVFTMARNGTLSVAELGFLPANWIATIVKEGWLNLMGMNEKIYNELVKVFDPSEQKEAIKQVEEVLSKGVAVAIEYVRGLALKAKYGTLTEKERMVMNELAKRLSDPSVLNEFFKGVRADTSTINAAYQYVDPRLDITNRGSWVDLMAKLGDVGESVDNWIATTFNVKQPVQYLIDGINSLRVALGLEKLPYEDEERLRMISSIAGIGSYSETIGSILGAITGYYVLGRLPAIISKVGPLSKLMESTLNINAASKLSGVTGALMGAAMGGQLLEPVSWNAIAVKNQVENYLYSKMMQENIENSRAWQRMQSLSIQVSDMIDIIKAAYYNGEYGAAVQTLSNAASTLRIMEEEMRAYQNELIEAKAYHTAETVLNSLRSQLQMWGALIKSKDPSLAALINSVSQGKAAVEIASEIVRLKEENPVPDWKDVRTLMTYLGYMQALKSTIQALDTDKAVLDRSTIGPGNIIAYSFPMDIMDRLQLNRILKPKGSQRELIEMDVESPKTYVAPYYDRKYYNTLTDAFISLGLYKTNLSYVPDWIKSIILMIPKFYKSGKERGYWYPYEMLGLVILMLLLGTDFSNVLHLLGKALD